MKLVIFTPTYNRKNEIVGLYQSILKSVNQYANKQDEIEWLIINDGSEVDLSDTINSFKNEEIIITLLNKKNGGKHSAFNLAIEESKGDILVCIDDDDRLTINAVSDIFKYAKEYKDCGYGAFVGRVVDEKGNLLGKNYDSIIVSNTIEIRDKYRYWGEPEIYYLDILKQYKFTIFGEEKFLTEAYLFDVMSKEYPFVYLQVPLMIKKYLKGGLTDNQLKIRVKSPNGTVAYYSQRFVLSKGLAKVKAAINKVRFRFWVKEKNKFTLNVIDFIIYPIAYLMYLKDKYTLISK